MYNDYCVANHRSTYIKLKYECQESIENTSTYLTIEWRRRGRVCQIPQGKKVGDEIYTHIFNKFNPKNKLEENREK